MIRSIHGTTCILLCLGLTAAGGATEANLNLTAGGKVLDHTDWSPTDVQGEGGVQFDIRPDFWPLHIAVNVLGSSDTELRDDPVLGTTEYDGSTSELQVGAKWVWKLPAHARPYVGGGVALVYGEQDIYTNSTVSESSGWGVGYWVHGGVYWTLGRIYNVGPQIGFSSARVRIAGRDLDAGGFRAGVVFGAHW